APRGTANRSTRPGAATRAAACRVGRRARQTRLASPDDRRVDQRDATRLDAPVPFDVDRHRHLHGHGSGPPAYAHDVQALERAFRTGGEVALVDEAQDVGI